jgi:hypothetical protein
MARRSRVLEYFEQSAQERERIAVAEAEAAQQGQPPQDGAAPEEGADAGGEQQQGGNAGESTLLADVIALISKAVTQWLGK